MKTQHIGRRIKTVRERKGLTQEQLAAIVDLSPMHISVLERGVKPPKLETLVKIANALGVSADVLLQDVLNNRTESVDDEVSALIGMLPGEDQWRVMEALRGFVAATIKQNM